MNNPHDPNTLTIETKQGRLHLMRGADPAEQLVGERIEVAPDAAVVRHPSVAWVQVGPEIVIHDATTTTSHVLDHMAGLLWQCLDGTTLAELFADIADGFGVDSERVSDDFLPVVEDWVNNGIAQVMS